jgi:hypothetical protein
LHETKICQWDHHKNHIKVLGQPKIVESPRLGFGGVIAWAGRCFWPLMALVAHSGEAAAEPGGSPVKVIPKLRLLAGPEHGRTIPLAVVDRPFHSENRIVFRPEISVVFPSQAGFSRLNTPLSSS